MANEFVNRIASPMELCEETLDEPLYEMEDRKRSLIEKQTIRSPFLIGSMDEVNQRISKLDKKLQGYTELICESRSSGPQDYVVWNDFDRDSFHIREMETKEVNRFAGIFTLKSTFVPGLSTRVRNISKISMVSKQTSLIKKDPQKPKFVELHQYPGYDPTELTPLPDDIDACDMLKKAADATMKLEQKPHFRPAFEKLFYSQLSQALLQDIFWYFFLEKFQSSRNSQEKLFNRVAHNYVKQMLYAKDPLYRDTFFKKYPILMAQAVYASMYHSFPDSYLQFGESFKDELVSLVMEWMTGLRPSPRCWRNWDFDKLEPANMKAKIEMKNTTKSSMVLDFDYLDSLVPTNQGSQYTSNTSLNHSFSKSSINSGSVSSKRHAPRGHRSKRISTNQHKAHTSGSQESITETIDPLSTSPRHISKKSSSVDPHKQTDTLPPIREMTGEDEENDARKPLSKTVTKESMKGEQCSVHKVESHPACRGPNFVRAYFNTNGQSPLVAHFMRMKNLTPTAGTDIFLQRTELDNLPPIGAPTYRDVIRESSKNITEIERNFQKMYAKNIKESYSFMRKQAARQKEHLKRESSLLSKTKEVKRLSDLIILEQTKGPDSISVGASAAIEKALMGQVV